MGKYLAAVVLSEGALWAKGRLEKRLNAAPCKPNIGSSCDWRLLMRRILFFLALLALTLCYVPLPAQAATKICFKEVPNCIEGRFAEYWRQNGGLAIFGFPLNAAHQ